MHTYEVKVGTVYYQPTLVRINMELSSSPWTFEIDVPSYPTGLRSSDTINVYRDGVDIFRGKVLLPTQNFEFGQGWKLSGIDYVNFLLKNGTYALRGEVSQEPRTTIQSATSYASVSNGSQDAYGSSIPIRIDWNQCIDVVSQITGRIGWETLVRPTVNMLDFKSAVGSDKSSTVAFRTGENCLLANYQDRRDQVVNRIWAKGKGTSDTNEILLAAPYYVEDGTSQSTYGIRSKVIVERDIYTQAGLLTRANTLLAKLKDSWPVYSIKVKDQSKTDLSSRYWVGDTVAFKCGEMGISGNYRINSMNLSWDENDEIINLELNKLGLAFQNLAEQERSYLLGLYGPQIFSESTGVTNVNGSDVDSSASSAAGSNSSEDSDNTVDHLIIAAPTVTGGDRTSIRVLIDEPSSNIYYEIRRDASSPPASIAVSAPRTLGANGFLYEYFTLHDYLGAGYYGLYVFDQATGAAKTCDQLGLTVKVFGSHTHGVTSPAHGHTHSETDHIH